MFDEDLSTFFNEEEFASHATFYLPDGSTLGFSVIFDDAFLNPQTGLVNLDTTEPQATCPQSSIDQLVSALAAFNGGTPTLEAQSIPLRGLPCSIDLAPGKKYSILQIRPEGTGTAAIILSNEPNIQAPVPVPSQQPEYLPEVTGLTGGGPTNLDGVPTAGLSSPRLYQILISDAGLQTFKLRAKTSGDVVDGVTIIKPTDFNSLTNNVVLVEIK